MSKPLDQMSTQELKLAWGKEAKDFLVGRKIVDVYYHSEKENEEIFGDMDARTNIKIVFDNGHWITASRDDEGNGSGVIFTTDPKLSVIPSIQRGTPEAAALSCSSFPIKILKIIKGTGFRAQAAFMQLQVSRFQAQGSRADQLAAHQGTRPKDQEIFFNYLVDYAPIISYIIT